MNTILRTLLALALWVALGINQAVFADATTYSTTKRQFKVGILLIDSTTVVGLEARGPENPDPFTFYVADQRNDVKPQNWDFVNPLAPGVVTADVRDRWLARDPSRPYQLGQKVTKDMAAYWEVYLSKASIQDLLQYDLLFIHNHRPTGFSPIEREKLRKLVDAGGVVWMENCGNMFIPTREPFFLENVQLRSAGGGGQPHVYQADHPILNSPYQLSLQEVANLGDKNYAGYVISTQDAANPADRAGNGNTLGLNLAPNPETLVNIVANTAATDQSTGLFMPYIAAGNYGGGSVLITAGDSSCDINDYIGGTNAGSGGNSGAYSGNDFVKAHTEDLKFLYNIVAWGSQATSERRNNRRVASSFDSVGAPVVTAFNFDNAFTRAVRPADIVNTASSPLVVKNAIFVAGLEGGNVTVRCYDSQPFADLDGDGNFDDGIPDISLGLPYDEVWRWTGGASGQPSSPSYASVLMPNGQREDRIFLALGDGSVVILQAFPTANGSILPTQTPLIVAGQGNYATSTGTAPAPVFFENRLYQALPNGMMRCINAVTGAVLFSSYTTAPNYGIQPLATPTLGFVRQVSQLGAARGQAQSTTIAQNSNDSTNDLMLYAPSLITEANGQLKFRMIPYWLGTRNEVTTRYSVDPTEAQNGILVTRAAGGGSNGPQGGWYYVANGGNSRPNGVFIQPRVSVFSGTRDPNDPTRIQVSARENYTNGAVSTEYMVDNGLPPISQDGKIHIVPTANGIPLPRPGQSNVDILLAVDYDVIYIPNGENPPPNYTSNRTGIGARQNGLLDFDFPIGNLLSSPALSPDDFMVFGVQQQFNSGANGNTGPAFSSVFAINEQDGDASLQNSRLRWKFSIFNDFTDTVNPGDIYFTRTVDTMDVTDVVPLRNFLRFDPAWPRASAAIRMAQPEALRQVTVIGSPIVTNDGISYVLARAVSAINGPVTVLMAYKTNPVITLTLPEPFEETGGVTILQTDLLSDPNNPGVIQAAGSVNPGDKITIDGALGRVTINNSRISGTKSFSASQSFVVRYTPKGSRDEKRVVIPPVPLAQDGTVNLPVDATGQITVNSGGFTPLLWYYVVPGTPGTNTSPTLIGDYIYWSGIVDGGAHLYALDARPQDNDARIRIGFGEQAFSVVATLDGTATQVNHVRATQRISTQGTPIAANLPAIVAGQGTLLVNTNVGTYAYQQGVTLIAEGKRLIEAGGDGSALWAMDATKTTIVGGGEEPVFGPNGQVLNPPATGVSQTTQQTFARPSVARRVQSSDYLVADTGNNRVVRTDRGGQVKWSLARFVDPYGILASGESTTLNGPTDVQFYSSPTVNGNGAVIGYEVHYLVADAGNFRIIEVADYFDRNGRAIAPPAGGAQAGDHVLVWTTRTGSDGKRYRFQSIQRFLGFGPAGGLYGGFSGYPFLTAIISNSTVGTGGSDTRADFTGGAVVSISYAPYNTTVALRNGNNAAPAQLWPANAAPRTTEPIGNGTVLLSIEKVRIVSDGVGVEKRISAPIFFQQLNLPGNGVQRTLFLLCDAEAAYVVESVPQNNGTFQNNVLWLFNQSDYNAINGVGAGQTVLPTGRLNFPGFTTGAMLPQRLVTDLPRFQPTSLQLLPSGNYLITNSYAGRSTLFEGGQFVGEVLEVDPAGLSVLVNAPFGDTRRGGTFANFSVPRLQRGTTGNGLNSQVMGNPKSNTGLLEQPLYSFRP